MGEGGGRPQWNKRPGRMTAETLSDAGSPETDSMAFSTLSAMESVQRGPVRRRNGPGHNL
jgi:hypothetical protein